MGDMVFTTLAKRKSGLCFEGDSISVKYLEKEVQNEVLTS